MQFQDSHLWLGCVAKLEEDARVVSTLRDVVNVGVVNLQHEVLDVRSRPHPEGHVLWQLQLGCVLGPGVQDLRLGPARLPV